jgi:serine/threonine-protein kinase
VIALCPRLAGDLLRQGLAIRARVYGRSHPSVASTLNEPGRVAQQQGRVDEAEADFRRMADIYQAVYHDRHYLIGVALSNLGSVYPDRKNPDQAERLFRDAIRRYGETLAADHLYVGTVRIRLGRALLRQRRFTEVEAESRAGYEIVSRKPDPPATWLQNAREDLAAEYESLGQADKAAAFRAAAPPPEAAAGN